MLTVMSRFLSSQQLNGQFNHENIVNMINQRKVLVLWDYTPDDKQSIFYDLRFPENVQIIILSVETHKPPEVTEVIIIRNINVFLKSSFTPDLL